MRGLTDWVNIGAEELGGLSEELEDGDTTGSLGEREDLNEERYRVCK